MFGLVCRGFREGNAWLFWVFMAMLIVTIFRELAVASIRLVASKSGVVVPANMLGKVKTVMQMACIILGLCEPVAHDLIGRAAPSFREQSFYGFYALTDEFILSNAPYESNFAEVLKWTDHPDYVIKNSIPGDSAKGTVDRIITDVNAVQSKKNVFATFRTTPDGEYTTISIPYGSNYKQSENMLAIKAAEEYDGKPFAYWEVRKTVNGAVVAKSYKPLFDLCMMDNYRITPVYSESQEEEQLPSITLAHIDDTRNTWTDDKNEVPADGTTDMLYTDFEIAFDDGLQDIYTAPEGTYRTGVVFEQCATLPANKTFDSSKDYKLVSDEANLKAAVLSNSSSYVYDPAKPDKTRNIQVRDIPQSSLTNRDRVQYGKVFQNAYKDVNGTKTYTNGRYLLKVTAYLVKGGQVTLSNSVYVCLAAESEKDLAINCNIVERTTNG